MELKLHYKVWHINQPFLEMTLEKMEGHQDLMHLLLWL